MTTKQYTAEDFADAKSARHPDRPIAARLCDNHILPWLTDGEVWFSDADMADHGWVPGKEK